MRQRLGGTKSASATGPANESQMCISGLAYGCVVPTYVYGVGRARGIFPILLFWAFFLLVSVVLSQFLLFCLESRSRFDRLISD